MMCSHCNGQGVVQECEEYFGFCKKEECMNCDGLGFIDCQQCEGTGEMELKA